VEQSQVLGRYLKAVEAFPGSQGMMELRESKCVKGLFRMGQSKRSCIAVKKLSSQGLPKPLL